jgi:hypothetical protein
MNNRICGRIVTAAAVALMAHAVAIAGGIETQREAGGIAFHYVGRVQLNFLDNTGIVYGYMTALSGTGSTGSLFMGTPSEATAYLTFRANIKFKVLPGNGVLGTDQFAVTPILVEPGTWSIYFMSNPAHNWDDPDTFSGGQVVATLDRPVEQFSVYPTFSINAGAAVLKSSVPFTIGGQTHNLRALMPHGLVDITSGPPIPLSGSTATGPIFAFSGYSLVPTR